MYKDREEEDEEGEKIDSRNERTEDINYLAGPILLRFWRLSRALGGFFHAYLLLFSRVAKNERR